MQQYPTTKIPIASDSETAPEEISNLPQALTITNNKHVMENVDEIKPFYSESPTQDAIENHQTEFQTPSPIHINYRKRSFKRIRQRISTEKTTFILVAIVILFAITHSNRLALKMYMTLHPGYSSLDNFTRCLFLGR